MQPVRFPNHVEDITSDLLTHVISQTHPGAVVDGFDIISARGLGKWSQQPAVPLWIFDIVRDLRRFLDGSS